MKLMSEKIAVNILLFILASFIVVSTALKRVEVFNKSELNNLSCGWPIKYIFSGFEESRLDPPYPLKTNCISGGWGDPVDICWKCFIFDVAFFYLFILALYKGKDLIVKKKQKKKGN